MVTALRGDCCWRIVDGEALDWAPWPVDVSVFNRGTGETHLLSALPAETLLLLTGRPWAFLDLCARVADRCETEDNPAWHGKIAQVLDQLAGLELIEAFGQRSPVEEGVHSILGRNGGNGAIAACR